MFVHHRLPSSYSPIRVSAPALLAIPTIATAALEMADRLDRRADAELEAGNFAAADRLTVVAHAARARARG